MALSAQEGALVWIKGVLRNVGWDKVETENNVPITKTDVNVKLLILLI